MDLASEIEKLKEIVKKSGLNISDDVLLQEAGRNYRQSLIPNKKPTETIKKATKPQIDLLYKLNADFDAKTITKQEASDLISKLTKGKGY